MVPVVGEQTKLLFRSLHGVLNDNIVRETILASVGMKVSRTCLSEEELSGFIPIARRCNLEIAVSRRKYIHRPDIGKGGWSNSAVADVPADHPEGLFNVYLAVSQRLVAEGIQSEEGSDEDSFGSLLGVPACCRDAYLRHHPLAQQKQNDFVPLVLDNTAGDIPYIFWNNYVTQYFERSLLSFFPCSYNCLLAARFAETTYEILQQCSPAWAESFIRSQRTNILYTEYLGLHDLRNSVYRAGWIDYDADQIVSTEVGEVREHLLMGNRLHVVGKHWVKFYRGDSYLDEIEDEDISLCIFN